jgi:hypothetical protein
MGLVLILSNILMLYRLSGNHIIIPSEESIECKMRVSFKAVR